MPIKYEKKTPTAKLDIPVVKQPAWVNENGEPIVDPEKVKNAEEFVSNAKALLGALGEQAGVNVEIKEVKGFTKKKNPDGSVEEVQEELMALPMIPPMCNVGMRCGQTLNMGDYNSLKIEVSLNVPCGVGELDDTYKFVENWVDGKMQALLDEVKNAKKG